MSQAQPYVKLCAKSPAAVESPSPSVTYIELSLRVRRWCISRPAILVTFAVKSKNWFKNIPNCSIFSYKVGVKLFKNKNVIRYKRPEIFYRKRQCELSNIKSNLIQVVFWNISDRLSEGEFFGPKSPGGTVPWRVSLRKLYVVNIPVTEQFIGELFWNKAYLA